MKKLLFVLSLLVTSFQSQANSSSALSAALSTVAVTGTIVSVSQLQYQRWLKAELKDWQASDTKVSTALGESCGIPIELRVLGDRRSNLFYFAISNKTDSDITLKPQRIEIKYSTGRRRFAKFPFRQSDIAVKQGWWASGILPAPTKKDFKNIDSITISIPYYTTHGEEETCRIEGILKRNKDIDPLVSSYNRTHYLDFLMGFGVAKSDASIVADNSFSFLMQFGLYFGNGHGMAFGVGRSDADAVASRKIQIARSLSSDNINLAQYNLGYINETEFRDFHYFYWGLGASQLNLNHFADGRSHDIISEWGAYAQFSYDFNFARVDFGRFRGDYFVGILLHTSHTKEQTLGGVKIGGFLHKLLATFRLSI